MDDLKQKVHIILESMGFRDFEISADEETKRLSVLIHDEPIIKDHLGSLVASLNALIRIIGKKTDYGQIIFDVNNYRRERENIIADLAKAAARKVIATKEPVELPIMNAYERRIVHAELSMRPDVTTESVGEGKGRRVVVRAAE